LIKKNATKAVFAYSTLGIQLALFMTLFVYGGFKLDSYLKSSPWFVVLGAFLGLGTGFYNFIKGIRQIDKMSKEEKPEDQKKTKWL
jgi:F0F1-type ATP synthase assembly protein I